MRIAALGLIATAGMLALAGCGGGGTHTVAGSVTVVGVNSRVDFGPFSDVGPGTDVIVKDQSGTTIATAKMGDSTVLEGTATAVVKFNVELSDAPTFYAFTMGHRAAMTYSHAEMVTKNWKVDLSLGS